VYEICETVNEIKNIMKNKMQMNVDDSVIHTKIIIGITGANYDRPGKN
jgi:hypothetical protein